MAMRKIRRVNWGSAILVKGIKGNGLVAPNCRSNKSNPQKYATKRKQSKPTTKEQTNFDYQIKSVQRK